MIPKTSHTERLAENIDVLDFNLDDKEYEAINKLNKGIRFFNPIEWDHFGNLPYFE